MGRNRTRTLGAAPTGQPGKIFGIPTNLLAVGVALAAGYAWLSAGSGEDTPADSAGGTTPASSGSAPGSTTPSPTTSTPGSTGISKKKRPTVIGKAAPALYVFVNSVGGEGIFDRLTTTYSVTNGYGLIRICTLDNYEFAGYDTNVKYTDPASGRVYIKLYQEVNGIAYNYWIEKSETVAMHANGVDAATAAGYQWGGLSVGRVFAMTEASKLAIKNFYWNNYIL